MGRLAGIAFLMLLSAASARADIVDTPLRAFGFGEVTRAILSPNGAFLASAGQAGAFLWDFEQRTVLHRLESPHTIVSALTFSSNSRVLFTGDRRGVVREWDTDSGRLLREHTNHTVEINALACSPDGATFASASGDSTARVWSMASGEVIHTLAMPGEWIHTVAYSPDGSLLATSDSAITNNVRIWNLATGTLERSLGLHVGNVWQLQFLLDGRLATAGDDKKVRIWNAQTGALIRTLEGGPSLVNGLATSSNTVVAGFVSGAIITWNVDTGVLMSHMPTAPVWHLSASSASNRVIVVSGDLIIREWDLTTETVATLFEGHTTSTVLGLTFTPDGAHVISGGSEAKVRVWNRTNAAPVREFVSPSGTSAAVLSSDGRHLLTTAGVSTPRLQLWNMETGELEREFSWPSGWPAAAAYSANDERVAAGTMNNEVHLFNVASGSRTTLPGHVSAVRSVAFSADGALLASGDAAGAVRIWNALNGQWQRTLTIGLGWVTAVAFSPTTNELMTASEDGFVHFWNPETGALLRTIPVTGGFLETAVYSPNGKYALTGEGWPFFVAELWHVATGELLRVFTGHSSPVSSVAFSADGWNVLTGSDVVRLWDVADLLGRLHSNRTELGLELQWHEGTLQQATNVSGPWIDITNAVSPWPQNTDGAGKFYRLKLRD